MAMTERLDDWMDQYVLAWSSNETEHISALFTDEAVYDPQTEGGEWEGIDEIISRWQEIDDTEDNWDFEWRPPASRPRPWSASQGAGPRA
jgi:hypothetical protein